MLKKKTALALCISLVILSITACKKDEHKTGGTAKKTSPRIGKIVRPAPQPEPPRQVAPVITASSNTETSLPVAQPPPVQPAPVVQPSVTQSAPAPVIQPVITQAIVTQPVQTSITQPIVSSLTTTPTAAVMPASSPHGLSDTVPAPFTGILAEHNFWRRQVGSPALVWSQDVARYAQEWAEHLKNTQNCAMMHRPTHNFGENIAGAYSGILTPKTVVDMWAGEWRYYSHADNACQSGRVCGHYTQIVWKDSRQLGCGAAQCANGQEVWVCNYSPVGNIVGRKPY